MTSRHDDRAPLCVLLLPRELAGVSVLEQLQIAADRRQWRPQLVAHRRQEVALLAVQPFEPFDVLVLVLPVVGLHDEPSHERSDLLEQLQRETAAHERERIGRDLHDSAVQPYLGLKYGLEALARQAGAHNPISPKIAELVRMTTEELQTLRDVVSGLRSGQDPASGRNASLNALPWSVSVFV